MSLKFFIVGSKAIVLKCSAVEKKNLIKPLLTYNTPFACFFFYHTTHSWKAVHSNPNVATCVMENPQKTLKCPHLQKSAWRWHCKWGWNIENKTVVRRNKNRCFRFLKGRHRSFFFFCQTQLSVSPKKDGWMDYNVRDCLKRRLEEGFVIFNLDGKPNDYLSLEAFPGIWSLSSKLTLEGRG